MSLSWIEALIAINENVIACERRFHRQCTLVAERAAQGLVASYMASLTLIRAHRDNLPADAPTDA